MPQNNGIIYYNHGGKFLARLMVSLYSLRQHYNGNVAIMVWNTNTDDLESCKSLAKKFSADIINVDCEVAKCKYDYFLVKTRLPLYSKFDNTIYIDADTIILHNFDELFKKIDKNDFVVVNIGRWTRRKRSITRLLEYANIYPKNVEYRIQNYVAINCGVFGFNKRSTLVQKWYDFALPCKDFRIPDEDTCSLMLKDHKHKLISEKYNSIWKIRKPTESTKIVPCI